MTIKPLAPIALCVALAACGGGNGDAASSDAQQAAAAGTTDPASRTQAVYGDEAPVTVEAAPAAEEHAHNADGSHAEGAEHAQAEGDHAHEPGAAEHDH